MSSDDSTAHELHGPRWLRPREQRTVAWLAALYLLLVGGRLVWLAANGQLAEVGERKPPPPLRVDVNHAEVPELALLPGIGPALAQRIVDGRPYQFVEQLREVDGIGPKTMDRLRPHVVCGPDRQEPRPGGLAGASPWRIGRSLALADWRAP